MNKSVVLKIYGKVQNVGFRFHTKKTADSLQITGFVKNQPDGSVYIEAEGNESQLDHFILWCQNGPTWARVERIEMQSTPIQDFKGFVVK